MGIWDRYCRKSGLLAVLSGPSGVGKDAVLSELLPMCLNLRQCVTYTTRPPRQSEVSGSDYHFVSEEEFMADVQSGGFLEHAEVHGHLYGTPRRWVEDTLARATDVVLKIDVQGGINVKRQVPSCVMVFLVPPSMEELERRLRGRLTENADEIERRQAGARQEMEQIPNYDYVVENDTVRAAAETIKAILIAEHCRIK